MRKNIGFGIIVILIGVIWLLNNLDLFPRSLIEVFFQSLGKLWPLILIGAGVSILAKENKIVKLLTWLIVFVAILLYGILATNDASRLNFDFPFKLGSESFLTERVLAPTVPAHMQQPDIHLD